MKNTCPVDNTTCVFFIRTYNHDVLLINDLNMSQPSIPSQFTVPQSGALIMHGSTASDHLAIRVGVGGLHVNKI